MHYHLIVVDRYHEGVDELMEPFDENKEVPEYCRGAVDEGEKAFMMDYYNDKLSGPKYTDFEKCYEDHGIDWNGGRWRKDDDGIWKEYSTYNDLAEWDWWVVGGRWPGQLRLKDGVDNVHGVRFSFGWTKEDREEFLNTHVGCTDVAILKDIANLDDLTSYAILKDEEWSVIDGEKVAPYLEDVDDDAVIYSVDYHM